MGVRKIRFIIFEIIPKWQTSIKDCHCAVAEKNEKYKRSSLQPSPKEWNVEELHCAVAERMKV